ncbi:hypothetical protein FNV43_RR27341 [Rhamnella rubrinervis]|uniref:Uncharacterized protein n=1 Tax=Rhamnella rubrinervis TaxID=2594499 RepID=A0A8K0DPS7_9ROSA|nr:hypothetical protein FNV43_RR27341 [Rhamnella rubrinervis]
MKSFFNVTKVPYGLGRRQPQNNLNSKITSLPTLKVFDVEKLGEHLLISFLWLYGMKTEKKLVAKVPICLLATELTGKSASLAGSPADIVKYRRMREYHADVSDTPFRRGRRHPQLVRFRPPYRPSKCGALNASTISALSVTAGRLTHSVLARRGVVRTSQDMTHSLKAFNAPAFVHHPGRHSPTDDLSWLTKGATMRREQVVLSDFKVKVEGVGAEASSGVLAGEEGDDVEMVDASTPSSLEPITYDLFHYF